MPAPLIFWGGAVIAGVVASGWAAREGRAAFDSASTATQWAIVAGGLFVSYRALKASGAI